MTLTAADRVAKLDSLFRSGHTITVSTHLRAIVISPRTAKRFADAGRPIFKAAPDDNGHDTLWMAEGRRYVAILPSVVRFMASKG